MYGSESSATLTTDRLHYKLQIRPLVREGAPRQRVQQISGKTKGKSKIFSAVPMWFYNPDDHNGLYTNKLLKSKFDYSVHDRLNTIEMLYFCLLS
jgi:hypothetical protein